MLNEMSSDEFFTEIAKLIDKFGSDAVINAAKHIETSRNKYRYVSKDQNAFRNFTQPNAASPKRYKDCWITQDYNKGKKRDIFERLRCQLNEHPKPYHL